MSSRTDGLGDTRQPEGTIKQSQTVKSTSRQKYRKYVTTAASHVLNINATTSLLPLLPTTPPPLSSSSYLVGVGFVRAGRLGLERDQAVWAGPAAACWAGAAAVGAAASAGAAAGRRAAGRPAAAAAVAIERERERGGGRGEEQERSEEERRGGKITDELTTEWAGEDRGDGALFVREECALSRLCCDLSYTSLLLLLLLYTLSPSLSVLT